MKLKADKFKFMLVNFTENHKFNTSLENKILEETRLIGVVMNNTLIWNSNTEDIVKKACKRMTILHSLDCQ